MKESEIAATESKMPFCLHYSRGGFERSPSLRETGFVLFLVFNSSSLKGTLCFDES